MRHFENLVLLGLGEVAANFDVDVRLLEARVGFLGRHHSEKDARVDRGLDRHLEILKRNPLL